MASHDINIICDELPETLNICGEEFNIRHDVKTWIRVSSVMESNTEDIEKIIKIIALIFPKPIEGETLYLPKKLTDTLDKICEFYRGGEKLSEVKEKPTKKKNRIVSFSHDADLIHCAFLSQYGIDLSKSDMHWWEFLKLFSGLSGEHKILKIMDYRGTELTKIKDKKLKSHIRRMKRLYRLPDIRSRKQQDDEVAEIFAGGLF